MGAVIDPSGQLDRLWLCAYSAGGRSRRCMPLYAACCVVVRRVFERVLQQVLHGAL
jgi:hypothetical protein